MRKIRDISVVIGLLSLGRLAISIPNLEPIGAAALFGGALLGSWHLRFLIPFVALFVGDLILGAIIPGYADHLFSTAFFSVYLAFGATVIIGSRLVGKGAPMSKVVMAALISSVIFFFVTNFGTWLSVPFYTKDAAGLLECYVAGIAFYKQDLFGSFFFNSVFGNVFFSVVAFGLYGYYERKMAPAVV